MKKLVAGILCICLLVSMVLVGCATTPKETTASNIKIGVIGPMAFIQGQHSWMGAQIAADEINKAGGVNVAGVRRQIELVKVETNELASIPDAILAVERAINTDKVDFLVGGYRSEAALAYHEVAANAKKIIMSPPCGVKEILTRVKTNYDKYKYIFRVGGGNSAAVHILENVMPFVINEVEKALNIDRPKIALLGVQAAWPEQFLDLVKGNASSWGADIIGEWRPSMTANDLTAELTAIKSAGAQIIYTAVGGPVNVVFGKQYGELNIPAAPIGWAVETVDKGYWEATGGKCNYEASVCIHAPIKATERSLPFYEKFAELSGGKSPTQSACTYDAVWLIKEAVERAGTVDSDKVVVELEKLKLPLPSGIVTFTGMDTDEPHDVKWAPGLFTGFGVQWINGELVTFWPPADGSFGGVKYEGVKSYVLPPQVIQYWKNK